MFKRISLIQNNSFLLKFLKINGFKTNEAEADLEGGAPFFAVICFFVITLKKYSLY